ncbi:DUF4235 domain-containing protein [Pseudokineococcus marinus]|uniref:DUF4235 domain-containing protein n=1 Tax=Pseudokineococcus marinus TaxID=351215 RepID=A0A849BSE0_9ACTN|nr:DUF4235 domain-containing protein [Pseudokineococcus marinus]NNH23907.1 DUF4235 domain-containing protein [Pseudokineococcus marinus]
MGDAIWKVVGTGGAVAAGIAANKVLTAVWRKSLGGEPPINPESDETTWKEAIAWALLSGAVVGVARLAFRRNAASYYRKSTGHLPGNLEKAS